MSDAVLVVSAPAAVRVRQLLDVEGDASLMLRVAVRPGGCSGFSYEMFFDSARADGDVVFSAEVPGAEPFSVVVDPSSAVLLSGATLKFSDGLDGAGFKVENPNAQRTCGCGQSFS